jgi:hypothetical protein
MQVEIEGRCFDGIKRIEDNDGIGLVEEDASFETVEAATVGLGGFAGDIVEKWWRG